MDSLIINIINDLTTRGINISFDDVYEAIVPINDAVHSKSGVKYDFIYIDWKERINMHVIKSGLVRNVTMTYINTAIGVSLSNLSQGNTKYIAEGTGFFSFLFLTSKQHMRFFGSCITFSMFELYIMSRLHTHASNMNLVLQWELRGGKGPYPEIKHNYWNYTQKTLNNHVSHWATKYDLLQNQIECRMVGDSDKFDTVETINFGTDRKRLFKALMFPLLDSYDQYIRLNEQRTVLIDKENNSDLRTTLDGIKQFIEERVTLLNGLLAKY